MTGDFMHRFSSVIPAAALLFLSSTAHAGEPVDLDAVTRIRDPGFRHSQVMDLAWHLTEAIGPRLTGSPSELAADIERHLRDEAVLASPPSTVYRLRKFVRRHRLAAAASLLVVVALALGTTAATIGLLRAKKEARTARQVSGFLTGMFSDLGPVGSRRGASPRGITDTIRRFCRVAAQMAFRRGAAKPVELLARAIVGAGNAGTTDRPAAPGDADL